MELVIERLGLDDWPWVEGFLGARLEQLSFGLNREVPLWVYRTMLESPVNWFLRVRQEREALVVFVGRGNGFEVHACADKGWWGWRWVRASRAVLRWFVEQTGAVVVTHVPRGDRRGLVYVRACGFRERAKEAGRRWFYLADGGRV